MTEEGENIILAFGCPPSRDTPADSTLAEDFFSFLENSADAVGNIALPGNLNFFHTKDRRNETMIKVCQPILLKLSMSTFDENLADNFDQELVRQELSSLIHELDDNQSIRVLGLVKKLLKKSISSRTTKKSRAFNESCSDDASEEESKEVE